MNWEDLCCHILATGDELCRQAEQLLSFWVNIRHPGALIRGSTRLEVSWVVQFVTSALPGACFWRKKVEKQSKFAFNVWADALPSPFLQAGSRSCRCVAVPSKLSVALVNQTSFLSLSLFPQQGFSVFPSPCCCKFFFFPETWERDVQWIIPTSTFAELLLEIPVRQSYGA